MILTSGTQKLQGRKVYHDPEPYRNSTDGTRSRYIRNATPWLWDWDPRPEYAVQDNPILAAYREYPDHSVESVENWLNAVQDANDGGTPEVSAIVIDSLGTPTGPGWEDPYWVWQNEILKHAASVFIRLINLNG